MAVSLCKENLSQIRSLVDVPEYVVSGQDIKSGILHIGPSTFMRAHLAEMADGLLDKQYQKGEPLSWGITAMSLNNPRARDELAPQDFLYSVTPKGSNVQRPRVIGSVQDILVASENPAEALDLACNPDIKVISLTVTQNGYYFDKEKGFDFDHDDIQKCLDESSDDVSSIGFIVSVLERRKERGIAPPTIMSMDNLNGNGKVLKGAVLAYANTKSEELADWISQYVGFPDTMVDRITPKTTKDHIEETATKGVAENWPIQTENMPRLPFVLEDIRSRDPETNKPTDIPDFEPVGGIVTNNVGAYELLKVRTLNGVHMALGCIGHLSGASVTGEALKNEHIRRFAQGFMQEVGQTLKPTHFVSHEDFRQDVVARLDNPHMPDPLTRLSRNGVSKIPSRVLETMRDIISMPETTEKDYNHLSFTLAAWVTYVSKLQEDGRLAGDGPEDEPNDAQSGNNGGLGIAGKELNPFEHEAYRSIIGHALAENAEVRQNVLGYIQMIKSDGMLEALKKFNAEEDVDNVFNASNDTGTRPARAPRIGAQLINK